MTKHLIQYCFNKSFFYKIQIDVAKLTGLERKSGAIPIAVPKTEI